MKKIGYTHGRYQPYHKGHFKVHQYILKQYDELWIGIANPLLKGPLLPERLKPSALASVKKGRSPKENPYTFVERYEMIFQSLMLAGVDMTCVRILPHFAFYDLEDWQQFLPPKEQSVIVLSPKDPHHFQKGEFYRKEGWELELIPQFPGYSGKAFDAKWPDGDWRALVPKGTASFLEKHKR